jgi:hypothetical protein
MKNNTHWLVLGAALALSACTTKNESSYLQIEDLIHPVGTANSDGGTPIGCTFSTGTEPYTIQTFNTTRDFYVALSVHNNLHDNSDPTIGRINTNDFIVSQVVTEYESTDGTALNQPETITPAQGFVAVGVTVPVGSTLIPAAAAANLANLSSVRLHIRVEGRLHDGSTASTNEFYEIFVPTVTDQDSSSCVTSK